MSAVNKNKLIIIIFFIFFCIAKLWAVSDFMKNCHPGNEKNIFCQSDDNEDVYQEPEQSGDGSSDKAPPQPDDSQDNPDNSASE